MEVFKPVHLFSLVSTEAAFPRQRNFGSAQPQPGVNPFSFGLHKLQVKLQVQLTSVIGRN